MYSRLQEDKSDDYHNIEVSDAMMTQWAKLTLLYYHNNPHIKIDPVLQFDHHDNGDITAKLKGTDLSMRISSEEWQWTE